MCCSLKPSADNTVTVWKQTRKGHNFLSDRSNSYFSSCSNVLLTGKISTQGFGKNADLNKYNPISQYGGVLPERQMNFSLFQSIPAGFPKCSAIHRKCIIVCWFCLIFWIQMFALIETIAKIQLFYLTMEFQTVTNFSKAITFNIESTWWTARLLQVVYYRYIQFVRCVYLQTGLMISKNLHFSKTDRESPQTPSSKNVWNMLKQDKKLQTWCRKRNKLFPLTK